MHHTENTKQTEPLSVGQLFEELESKTSKKRILLTGNGFNRAFGYETGYKALFEAMKKEDPDCYGGEFQKKLEECGNNLEKMLEMHPEIAQMEETRKTPYETPLAQKSIKMDFLIALEKKIRAGQTSQIRDMSWFIGEFDYVFTLNFDFLLYKAALLLVDKKEPTEGLKEIVCQAEKHLEGLGNFLPPEILGEASGDPDTSDEVGYDILTGGVRAALVTDILAQKKDEFFPELSKDNLKKEIIQIISGEEKTNGKRFSLRDGFSPEKKSKTRFTWKEENKDKQNFFHLHGALHIFKKQEENAPIEKIFAQSMGTLASEIREHVRQNSTMACVFKDKDKKKEIQESPYLQACLERLGEVEGVLVIHGSNFSNNDDHIWRAIRDNSGIKEVYVSLHTESEQEADKRARAEEKLNGEDGSGNKKIILFDGNVTGSTWFKDQKQLEEEAKKAKPAPRSSNPSP